MKQNRSVVRTKKGIRKAFIELLGEKKNIDKISVMELTERVGIVRSTFYSHYKDISSVAREIQTEMLDYIDSILDDYIKSDNRDVSIPIKKMYLYFEEHKVDHRELFGARYGESQIIGELKDSLAMRLYEKYPFTQLEFFNNDKKFESKFYASIFIGLIEPFLNDEYTLDEIVQFTIKLINKLK